MSTITTTTPSTGVEIETYSLMTTDETFQRLEAAHAAFLDWRTKTHTERAPYLTRIAEMLRDHSDELPALMTRETGKLIKDAKTEVEICAAIFEFTAKHGPDVLADEERAHGVVTRQPSGVIYSIQPWNFPLYQPVRVLAASLMAATACVLKHASVCTGSGLRLRELCIGAGLSEELFQVILIDHDTSDEDSHLDYLTQTIGDGQLLFGDRAMLVDIQLSYILALLARFDLLRDHSTFAAYWDDLQGQPGYIAAIRAGGAMAPPA